MKRFLLMTFEEALNIWATLAIGIILTSVLYAVLSISGVPKNTSLLISFLVLLGVILFSQYFLQPIRKMLRRQLVKVDHILQVQADLAQTKLTQINEQLSFQLRTKESIKDPRPIEENAVTAQSSNVTVYIEAPSGQRFTADVPMDTTIGKLAADFFESQNWPLIKDRFGRAFHAVAELVNPSNLDETKRLPIHATISNAGIRRGDILRIFPEAIAGCFPLGALIRMADGKQTPIESIKIDDEILAWDLDKERPISAPIVGIHKEQASRLVMINSKLNLSVSQPVWVNNSWQFAKDIKLGDELIGINRQEAAVQDISSVDGDNRQILTISSVITVHALSYIDGPIDVRHLSTFGGVPFFAEEILVQPYNALSTTTNAVSKQSFLWQ